MSDHSHACVCNRIGLKLYHNYAIAPLIPFTTLYFASYSQIIDGQLVIHLQLCLRCKSKIWAERDHDDDDLEEILDTSILHRLIWFAICTER